MSTHFVPAADEVWRLQRGVDAECRLFQSIANQGHYRARGGTRQGIYVCSPGGKLLASANTLDADRVLTMLREALHEWDELPTRERRLPADVDIAPSHRWEQSYPTGGLVLVSTNRDLPIDGDPRAAHVGRWNSDHVWYSHEEARAWLPVDPRPGNMHRVPDHLAHRLARFHLVDNVRGQTLPFAAKEVRRARLDVEVVDRTGPTVRVKISGSTEVIADGPWLMGDTHWKPPGEYPRGMGACLLGYATFDLQKGKFTQFRLIALGTRWGSTQNNARRNDAGPAPIGFLFTLGATRNVDRVAPAFIDVYNADWVVHPPSPPSVPDPQRGG